MIEPQTQHRDDVHWMEQAIALAKHGLYTTHPNPRVGCVIVKDGVVVGRGFHLRAGEPHAEVHALKEAGELANGATAYVTLEPCSHFGRTPPCCDALINAGVSRVVAAMKDPNPEVAGRGLARIQSSGISVDSGVLEQQARALNPGFLKRMEYRLPFVRLKQAISLDGRTAMASGESKWITGAQARSDVQRLRAMSDAIITGVESIIHDDSSLTVRVNELGLAQDVAEKAVEKQPIRVVLDTHLRIPEDAKILALSGETIVVTSVTHDHSKKRLLEQQGVTVWVQSDEGRSETLSIDLNDVLVRLVADREINEVLVEAGAKLSASFVSGHLVDEIWTYIAPKLMGQSARPMLDWSVEQMSDAIDITFDNVETFGDDLRVISRRRV